jgi:hypothetical protein
MRASLTFALALLLAGGCGKVEDVDATVAAPAATDAAPAAAAAERPAKLALTCAAPFTPDATAGTLAAAFGAENVIPETIDGPEGERLNVTAIFPTDPTRRVEVSFRNEEERTGLATATVKEDASIWTGPGGLKMGDRLEAVEAANGGVFQVAGFGWDYGGYVSDWKAGKLTEPVPGCRTSIRFKRAPDNQDNSLIGEQGRASDLPALRAAKPTVTEFGIRW